LNDGAISGTALAVLVGAYLLGGVPFSLLIVRLASGVDLRHQGSGNPGATNALRVGGKIAGVATLLLDVGKGVVAVLAAKVLDLPDAMVGAVAVTVVAGHVLSIYLRFRGGKGVAAAAGAMAALAPMPLLLCMGLFLVVVIATRYVAIGSLAAAISFVPFAYLSGRLGITEPAPNWLLLSGAMIALIIVVRHADNLVRLRAGTEVQLGALSPAEDYDAGAAGEPVGKRTEPS
jgi:glycerol-3-phosphate acyltransferase PlsY